MDKIKQQLIAGVQPLLDTALKMFSAKAGVEFSSLSDALDAVDYPTHASDPPSPAIDHLIDALERIELALERLIEDDDYQGVLEDTIRAARAVEGAVLNPERIALRAVEAITPALRTTYFEQNIKNGRKGGAARHEPMNRVKSIMISEYLNGDWKSTRQAAKRLVAKAKSVATEEGAKFVTDDVFERLYKWFLDASKRR